MTELSCRGAKRRAAMRLSDMRQDQCGAAVRTVSIGRSPKRARYEAENRPRCQKPLSIAARVMMPGSWSPRRRYCRTASSARTRRYWPGLNAQNVLECAFEGAARHAERHAQRGDRRQGHHVGSHAGLGGKDDGARRAQPACSAVIRHARAGDRADEGIEQGALGVCLPLAIGDQRRFAQGHLFHGGDDVAQPGQCRRRGHEHRCAARVAGSAGIPTSSRRRSLGHKDLPAPAPSRRASRTDRRRR